jgi:hypothetical protein
LANGSGGYWGRRNSRVEQRTENASLARHTSTRLALTPCYLAGRRDKWYHAVTAVPSCFECESRCLSRCDHDASSASPPDAHMDRCRISRLQDCWTADNLFRDRLLNSKTVMGNATKLDNNATSPMPVSEPSAIASARTSGKQRVKVHAVWPGVTDGGQSGHSIRRAAQVLMTARLHRRGAPCTWF